VHGEVVDLKFSIEKLNQRISWLVALHAGTILQRPVMDMSAQDAMLLCVPIPLTMDSQTPSQHAQVSPNVE